MLQPFGGGNRIRAVDRHFGLSRISLAITLLASGCTVAPDAPWRPLRYSDHPFNATVCVSSHLELGSSPAAVAERAFEIEMLKRLGIGCIRRDFIWKEIEPKRGEFHFENLDRARDELDAAGIEVLALLAYSNPWAEQIEGNDSSIDPADYAAFGRAVATHFRGRVRYYEIWNEPNWVFWRPDPDPVAYGVLFKATATAIREADADARIVLGGTFSLPGMLAGRVWDFVYDVADAHPDIGDYFDILSYHPYTEFQVKAPEAGVEGDERHPSLVQMTRAIERAGQDIYGGGKPIWNTEAGWASSNVGDDNQALYIVRALLLSAYLGVERFHVYTTFDGNPAHAPAGLPAEAWYGFLGWDPDPVTGETAAIKPAYRAIENLLTLTQGLRVVLDPDVSQAPDTEEDVFRVSLGDETKLISFFWRATASGVARTISAEPPAGWRLSSARYLLSQQDAAGTSFILGGDPLAVTYVRD